MYCRGPQIAVPVPVLLAGGLGRVLQRITIVAGWTRLLALCLRFRRPDAATP